MNLAIIMSGMLRNFADTYPTTKRFFINDRFFKHVDIFFCGYSDNLSLDESILRFKNLYKPKRFLIQEWNKAVEAEIDAVTGFKNWEITNKSSNLMNVMSSWRCKYIANCLRVDFSKKYNILYDCVFNLRTDMFAFSNIEKKLVMKAKRKKDIIYVPWDWDFKNVNKIAVGDIMAFGSPEAMNKYYSLYKYAKYYKDKKISNHAETLLGHHFIEMNLKRKFCKRNVVKEYPYSELDTFRLWEKTWPKEDFYRVLGRNI